MTTHPIFKEMESQMASAIEHTLHEFNTLHTGKASPSMVESVTVNAYGGNVKLKEIAAITTPDPRTIQVQPWDKSVIRDIEKALQTANIGINPSIDGGVIRLPIPELSRERRQELAKVAQRMAEDGRISVRHARREALEAFRKLEKNKELSEDELKRFEKEVQQKTEVRIKEIDQHLQSKEKELMAV